MPAIDAARFKAEALKANPTLGRHTKSSLDPIFKLLGSHSSTHLSPQVHEEVQELIPVSYTHLLHAQHAGVEVHAGLAARGGEHQMVQMIDHGDGLRSPATYDGAG